MSPLVEHRHESIGNTFMSVHSDISTLKRSSSFSHISYAHTQRQSRIIALSSAMTGGKHCKQQALKHLSIDAASRNSKSAVASDSDGSSKSHVSGSKDEVTLVVRNLPVIMTSQQLADALREDGMMDIDCVYVPSKSSMFLNPGHQMENKGFGFVNCTSSACAQRLIELWHFQHRFGNQGKLCNVSYARVQGRKLNEQQWSRGKMTRIRNPQLRPLFFTTVAAPRSAVVCAKKYQSS